MTALSRKAKWIAVSPARDKEGTRIDSGALILSDLISYMDKKSKNEKIEFEGFNCNDSYCFCYLWVK